MNGQTVASYCAQPAWYWPTWPNCSPHHPFVIVFKNGVKVNLCIEWYFVLFSIILRAKYPYPLAYCTYEIFLEINVAIVYHFFIYIFSRLDCAGHSSPCVNFWKTYREVRVQIQKEVISDFSDLKQFLSKEINESIWLIFRERALNRF